MALNYPSWKRWLLAVLLVLPLQLSFAADSVDRQVLNGLASDSNEDRSNAITALGLLSTPGAAEVLAALGDGNVLITSDGTVLLARNREQALNPATGEVEGEAPNQSVAQCLEAAARSADAFITWRNTLPRQRAEMLRRAFEIMIAEQEQLATLIVRENGKVLSDARAEVAYAAEFFR